MSFKSADEAIEVRLHARARVHYHLARAAAAVAGSDMPLGEWFNTELGFVSDWQAAWAVANNWLIEREEAASAG